VLRTAERIEASLVRCSDQRGPVKRCDWSAASHAGPNNKAQACAVHVGSRSAAPCVTPALAQLATPAALPRPPLAPAAFCGSTLLDRQPAIHPGRHPRAGTPARPPPQGGSQTRRKQQRHTPALRAGYSINSSTVMELTI
jgi:hypothetical protein